MKRICFIDTNLCGKILNSIQIEYYSCRDLAVSMLVTIRSFIGGDLRISDSGVPHLLVKPNKNGQTYSIAYFRKIQVYRVFNPYPSYNRPQKKRDFKTSFDVTEFFRNKKRN